MKKIFRKSIAYLLTAVLVLTSIPFVGFAQTDETVTQPEKHSFGDGLAWSLDETTGKLTIEGNGAMPDFDTYMPSSKDYPDFDMYDYFEVEKKGSSTDTSTATESGTATATLSDEDGDDTQEGEGNYAPWISSLSKIKSVVVSEGITSVGNNSFCFALYLQEVSLPSTLKTIGDTAFGGCMKLKKCNFPEGLEKIGHNAFGYTAIDEVTLPSTLKRLGSYAFGISLVSKLTMLSDFEVLPPPDADEGDEVSSTAFLACYMLRDISYPENMTDPSKVLGDGELLCNVNEISNPSTTFSFLDQYLAYLHYLSDEDFDFYVYKLQLLSQYAEILFEFLEPVTEDEYEAFTYDLIGVSSEDEISDKMDEINDRAAYNKALAYENLTVYCAESSAEHAAAKKYGIKHFVGDSESECNCFEFKGTVAEGLTWELNTKSRTLVFEGEGDIPEYDSAFDAPWFTLGAKYNTIDFSKAKIGSIGDDSFTVSRAKNIIFSSDIGDLLSNLYSDRPFRCAMGIEKIVLTEDVKSVNMSMLTNLLCDAENEKTQIIFLNKSCTITGTVASDVSPIVIRGYRNSTAETFAKENSLTFKPIITETDESDFEYKLSDEGKIIITKYKGTATDISIPATIDGKDVDILDDDAFQDTDIEYVIVPEGVTTIEYACFASCEKLEYVELPDSLQYICGGAFANCSALKEIDLGEGLLVIDQNAFDKCTSLSEITVPQSTYEIAPQAFASCPSLKLKILGSMCQLPTIYAPSPEFNKDEYRMIDTTGTIYGYTGSTAEEYATFFGVSFVSIGNLPEKSSPSDFTYTVNDDSTLTITGYKGLSRNIEVPEKIDNKTVTTIGKEAFTELVINKLTLPETITTVEEMAFFECYDLKELSLPKSLVTVGDYAFAACESIKEFVLPDGIKTIGEWAFADCISLEKVNIPNGAETIGAYAFALCPKVEKFVIPASVKSIGEFAFAYTATQTIEVDENNQYYTAIDGVLFSKDKTVAIYYPEAKTETTYTVPDTVESIGDSSFTDCKNLEEVTISGNVSQIGNSAFEKCTGLTTVNFEEGNTAAAVSFYSLSRARAVQDNEITIGDKAFSECTKLKTIVLPEAVTKIGASAFDKCTSLEKITVTNDECEIDDSAYTFPASAVICAHKGSTAQAYAEKYNRTFEELKHVHTWDKGTVTTPPTHLKEGVMTYKCTECEDTKTEPIAKLKEHSYNTAVTAPTCEDQGYTTYTCACGDTYTSDYVEAKGHAYTGEIRNNDDGTHSYKCVNGCETYSVGVAHEWDNSEVTTQPTHLKEGVKTLKCACGATKTESVDKLKEHTYTNTVVAPTCTEQGYTTHTCACGDTYTSDYVEAKGHAYTGEIKDNGNGTHSYKCVNGCETFGSGVAHEWDNGEVTTQPTHLKEGVKTFNCVCGATKTETVEKLKEHEWDGGTVTTAATHTKEGVKTYKCACGETKTEAIAKIGNHSYIATVVAPTCTEQGYTVHSCVCGDSYKDTFVAPTGHSFKDGVCTECGKIDTTNNGTTKECDCICHSTSGFSGVIYKILRFFWKLFKTKQYCDCGAVHY